MSDRVVLTDRSGERRYITGGPGGGDYQGLPINGVQHSRNPNRLFLGLDWSTQPATGPLWEWK